MYADAVARLKKAGLEVITHIIIGLPNDDTVTTTCYAVACGTDGAKKDILAPE